MEELHLHECVATLCLVNVWLIANVCHIESSSASSYCFRTCADRFQWRTSIAFKLDPGQAQRTRAPTHKQFAKQKAVSLCFLSIRLHLPRRLHCSLARVLQRQLQCDISIRGTERCFDRFTADVLAIVWNSHISSFQFRIRKHIVMLARPRCAAVSTCATDSAPIARGRRNLDGLFGRLAHSGRPTRSSKCTCVATRLPVDGTIRT